MNKKFVVLLICCLAFIISAFSTFALELKSDNLNYIITIPGTWTTTSQDQTGFYIKSQDGKKAVCLSIVSTGFARLDSAYIVKYEQVLQKVHHLDLMSSRVFTIDGVPAYENIQRLGEASTASVKVEHQIIFDGRLYTLSSVVFGGDATQDSEMQEGLTSFHFLHRPKRSLVVILTVVGVIVAGVLVWMARRRKIS